MKRVVQALQFLLLLMVFYHNYPITNIYKGRLTQVIYTDRTQRELLKHTNKIVFLAHLEIIELSTAFVFLY